MKNTDKVVELFNIANPGKWASPQRGRVYSIFGISPAVNGAGGGGNLEPKALVYEEV